MDALYNSAELKTCFCHALSDIYKCVIYCLLQYVCYECMYVFAVCEMMCKYECVCVCVVEPAPHQQWEAQTWLVPDMKCAATHKRAPVSFGPQRINRAMVGMLSCPGTPFWNTRLIDLHYEKHVWLYISRRKKCTGCLWTGGGLTLVMSTTERRLVLLTLEVSRIMMKNIIILINQTQYLLVWWNRKLFCPVKIQSEHWAPKGSAH